MKGEGALTGIRVLELGGRWAVPHATELLADMGAEVIKVEGAKGDAMRAIAPGKSRAIYAPATDGFPSYNRAGFFIMANRNKLSTVLDLRKGEGKRLFLLLVQHSDVVIQNLRPGLLDEMGLGYEELKAVNPKLVMCSCSGFGQTGPERFRLAVGVTIEPYCLSSVIGYPDGRPMRSGVDHCDPLSGVSAAGAIVAALIQRCRTGQGAFIDLAFTECLISVTGKHILDYEVNGRLPKPTGNGDDFMAPHGCYRCKGEDRWVAIAVKDDDEWQRLCRVMGAPWLGEDARFNDTLSRWHHKGELDGYVEEWTAGRDPGEAMELLQAAGVPCGRVSSLEDLLSDPQLCTRGFFQEAGYPGNSELRHKTFGERYKLSKTPLTLARPAPCYGEHNEAVWIDTVGLDRSEYDRLIRQKVILNEPPDDFKASGVH